MLKYKTKLFKNYLSKVVFKDLIEQFPSLFVGLQGYRYKNSPRLIQVVTSKTDIVIEGFPRSANSFSTRAFIQAQLPKKYEVANHVHSHAQIIHGINNNLPTIVLVRKPYDAIRSLGAHRLQILNHRKESADNYLQAWKIEWDIKYYITFYSALMKQKHKLIVAPFDEIVNDFGQTIIRLNKKFNTDFQPFEHTEENVKQIFENSWFHLSPSKERENYKTIISELLSTESCKILLNKANEVYDKFITEENG